MLGVVLIELNAGWDVVSENGSHERYPDTDFEVIGETNLLRIPPSPATGTAFKKSRHEIPPQDLERDSRGIVPFLSQNSILEEGIS